jgi:hypothetical protein
VGQTVNNTFADDPVTARPGGLTTFPSSASISGRCAGCGRPVNGEQIAATYQTRSVTLCWCRTCEGERRQLQLELRKARQ